MLRTVAATLLVLSTACAEDFWLDEELPFVDIRLGYGLTPIPSEYAVEVGTVPAGPTFPQALTVEEDQANSLAYSIVGGNMSPFGPLFGGELVYNYVSQHVTANSINGVPVVPLPPASLQYRTIGGNFLAGVGWALSSNFHLEALGVIGVGAMDLDFTDGIGTKVDGEGWYWNTGVRGGAYFTWGRLVIGGLVEYTRLDYTADANWAANNTEVDDVESGIGYRLEIGYHIQ